MKKIILCGATHGSNFGDTLFAYLFEKFINELNDEYKVYFTRVSDYTKEYVEAEKASLKDIFNAKALVYISGGYFGEAQKETFKGRIYHLLFYYIYGFIMAIKRKPIAIIGVGAGPLDSFFFRKLVLYIFKKAKIISLRDINSKIYMERYGCKNNIILTSDSAQILNKGEYKKDIKYPEILQNKKLEGRKKILIHITEAPGHELYEKNVISALKETLFLDSQNSFVITNDTSHDVGLEKILQENFPKERTVIYNYSNPFEFLGLIESVDSIITPKLHMGIIGATYGKPVIAFPVHPEKTLRYYEQIGYANHCFSLYELTKEKAVQIIEEKWQEKIELNDQILKNTELNFELLTEFLKKYVQ